MEKNYVRVRSLAFFTLVAINLFALDNGLVKKPPMGWNSWNFYDKNVTEDRVRRQVDAIVSRGLKDAGYEYVCIDDGWMTTERDKNHNLIPDPVKFPNGIKSLVDYVNSKGLKFGIYAGAGKKTCAGLMGSKGYEEIDALQFASWGVDYLKYDVGLSSCFDDYVKMKNALEKSGRAIVYSVHISNNIDELTAKEYAKISNLWRISPDVHPKWFTDDNHGVLNSLDIIASLWRCNGPSQWNDPDMLVVGHFKNDFDNIEKHKTHFKLWCLLGAPLLISCDLDKASQNIIDILIHSEAIEINQDLAGIGGQCVRDDGDTEIWLKHLGSLDGLEKALILLNRSPSKKSIGVNWKEIELKNSAMVRDVWLNKDLGIFKDSFLGTDIPPFGALFLKITQIDNIAKKK